ncbi:hypothetical protein [Streptomyces minutiscleroticus]|uniref:Secreted protein n=1 Tax=Streptomyces minutiscleroticus TaxID=68238 RepID=A0A918KHI7_9ACTN|nr:hypothetical protein [Streptomyces minutiscleroticus]GGX64050.1 hypothetical protein GCM10010358_17780 [Streptomyces minutiscleroticus]
MKSLKAVAVVAGSLAAAGAAAPAQASDVMPPTSLNGGLERVLSHPLEVQPVQSNALDTENEGSVLNAVNDVTENLNSADAPTSHLLGGLPLQG